MITIDGRPVLSRQDIHTTYGYPISALERWWSEREANGHPPVVATLNRTMYWDQQAWEQWDQTFADRAMLCEELGISVRTFDRLWRERATNNHPPVLRSLGRGMHWNHDQYIHWYRDLQPAEPERRGRPAGRPAGQPYAGDPRLALARQIIADHPDTRTTELVQILHDRTHGEWSRPTMMRLITTARQHPEG